MKKTQCKVCLIKIMVFGTFDMVHLGHRNLFKQARKLVKKSAGTKPFLIASIARDENVKKFKGHLPKKSERQRMKLVKALRDVDKAVLGGKTNHMPHIKKECPDIIALGYDQKAYVSGLKAKLKTAGLKTKVVRLKPHKTHLYKTSLIN